MKGLIQRLASIGADISTRKTLQTGLKILGVKPENVDRLFIEMKNDIHRNNFRKISPKDKIVFLPQCLRNPKCRARIKDFGYNCVDCCNCKASQIKKLAEKLGYSVFIVPGDSMVFRAIKELKPKAVVGIACLKELVAALEEIKLPLQTVELSKTGCINTDVNISDISKILSG